MTKEVSNLGKALTELNLEDKFLSNGNLSNFPLMERGEIAKDIISEKLKRGRWQTVVQMIYGNFGNANALFEGDREALKKDIVRSAVERPVSHISTYFGDDVIKTLVKAGEEDLMFNLATNIPYLDYDNFIGVVRNIDEIYFKDSEQGSQRSHTFHNLAGKKALEEEKFYDASVHFNKIDDLDGVSQVFDAARDHKKTSLGTLEEIALNDPSQKDDRLKEIVLGSIPNKDINPLKTYKLFKKHRVNLTPKDFFKTSEKSSHKRK